MIYRESIQTEILKLKRLIELLQKENEIVLKNIEEEMKSINGLKKTYESKKILFLREEIKNLNFYIKKQIHFWEKILKLTKKDRHLLKSKIINTHMVIDEVKIIKSFDHSLYQKTLAIKLLNMDKKLEEMQTEEKDKINLVLSYLKLLYMILSHEFNAIKRKDIKTLKYLLYINEYTYLHEVLKILEEEHDLDEKCISIVDQLETVEKKEEKIAKI